MQDEITYRILKAIDENPSQSQRELSRSLGISLGKANYCLKALIESGERDTATIRAIDEICLLMLPAVFKRDVIHQLEDLELGVNTSQIALHPRQVNDHAAISVWGLFCPLHLLQTSCS